MSELIGKVSRQIPLFRGKYALLRWLLQRDVKLKKDVNIRANKGVKFLLPNINEAIGFSIFINGVYEKDHIDFIVNALPVNGCFVDAGANIGSICIPVAKRRPDVKVIAIEASSKVHGYLKHNVQQNRCENIVLINKVLSNTSHQLIEFYSPDELYGKGSLNPVFTNKSEMVETLTMDDLSDELQIRKIDMVKIDVEGYEKIVFEGMERLFSSGKVAQILMEFCEWSENLATGCTAGSAQELLRREGFVFSMFNKAKLEPIPELIKTGQAMLVAKHPHE